MDDHAGDDNSKNYKRALEYISAAADMKKLFDVFCSPDANNPFNTEWKKVADALENVREIMDTDPTVVLVKYRRHLP